MPRETLESLLDLDLPVRFIKGNTDYTILEQMADLTKGREKIRWVAQQLHPDFEQVIASWPETISLDVSGIGQVLFCHATPQSATEVFTVITPADRMPKHFSDLNATLVVCGHTHMQFDKTVAGIRIVNAGSVGSAVGGPGAGWLLLGPAVTLRHTVYDLAAAAERVRRTGYPLADDFADKSILNPPSEEQMLEAYARNQSVCQQR